MGLSKTKKSHYFLDLFAGCGGASLGIETAGFENLGHVEIDSIAKETLKLNFGESKLASIAEAEGDVTKVNLEKLKKELRSVGISNLDLLVACPPCQGFSAAGRAKINSLSEGKLCFSKDKRNRLYKTVVKFVSELRPKTILFENVPGMLNVRGANIVETFCNELELLGYEVRCSVLNAAWYGVPQSRERVFVIAYRRDLKLVPRFPDVICDTDNVGGVWGQPIRMGSSWENPQYLIEPNHKNAKQPGISVKDSMCDLPAIYNHLSGYYRASRKKDLPQDYLTDAVGPYHRSMRNWPGFSSTVVTDHFARATPRDYELFRKMQHGDLFPQAYAIAENKWKNLKKLKAEGKIKSLPKKSKVVPPYRLDCFPEKWQKLNPEKLACTLTAHLEKDGYSHIHFDSKQARTLTIREAARLQSFPDGYTFHGSMGYVFRQIGNAVPPLVALALGKTILTDLNKVSVKPTTLKPLKKMRDETYFEI